MLSRMRWFPPRTYCVNPARSYSHSNNTMSSRINLVNHANALSSSRQRNLALMATAAVAMLAGCSMILSSGPTSSRINSPIQNDLGALPTQSGDSRANSLFRFAPDPDGNETPTAYFLNMMRARSYLLSQRFAINDKDVSYVGNAEANRPTELSC